MAHYAMVVGASIFLHGDALDEWRPSLRWAYGTDAELVARGGGFQRYHEFDPPAHPTPERAAEAMRDAIGYGIGVGYGGEVVLDGHRCAVINGGAK